MPKQKVDYNKTQIYKLIHNDDIDNENIYIGSTTNFSKRKNSHKRNHINEKSKNYNAKVYTNIRLTGGWSEWSMLLVENFPCIGKREADVRERYWIDYYKSQLNMIIPSRSWKERYNENKEKIIKYQKDYRNENKKILIEKDKTYRIINVERIIENYEKNKGKINEERRKKIQCECGCIISKSSLLIHQKTKKHLDLILIKII